MNAVSLPSKKPARVKADRPKPDYTQGKIYKISNVNNKKYYIGSTVLKNVPADSVYNMYNKISSRITKRENKNGL